MCLWGRDLLMVGLRDLRHRVSSSPAPMLERPDFTTTNLESAQI